MKDFDEWYDSVQKFIGEPYIPEGVLRILKDGMRAGWDAAWEVAEAESQNRATVAANNQVRAQYEAADGEYYECYRCGRIDPVREPMMKCPTCPKEGEKGNAED